MGTSLESRFKVYSEGIRYFFNSPIWGNNVETYGSIDIWHSTVIEYMVKSGIIGVTIYFVLLKNAMAKTLVVVLTIHCLLLLTVELNLSISAMVERKLAYTLNNSRF